MSAAVTDSVVVFQTMEPPPCVPYLYSVRTASGYQHMLSVSHLHRVDKQVWVSKDGVIYSLQKADGHAVVYLTVFPTAIYVTPHGARQFKTTVGACVQLDAMGGNPAWTTDRYMNVVHASTRVFLGRPYQRIWAAPKDRVRLRASKASIAVNALPIGQDYDVIWDGEVLWRVGRTHQWVIGHSTMGAAR